MEKLPVFKLTIKEDEEAIQEVNAVALVDVPAIGENFFAFKQHGFVEPGTGESEDEFIPRCIAYNVKEGKDQDQAAAICYDIWDRKQSFESYSDYPETVRNNAKRGIKLNEENGNKCATQVGKVRAQQLANGEPISTETIKRMYSYLSRAEVYYDQGESTDCGYISYLLWGGKAAKDWAESKLNKIEARHHFAVVNKEERVIIGPAMIPDMPIYRNDSAGEYYVFFDKKTIETIALKFYAKGFQQNANLMHEVPVDGVTFFMSWIADESKGIPKMKQFENLPDGTWFLGAKVNNDETWAKVKDGTFKGFSVEGMFDMTEVKMRMNEEQIIEKLKELLKDI